MFSGSNLASPSFKTYLSIRVLAFHPNARRFEQTRYLQSWLKIIFTASPISFPKVPP